MKKLFAVMLVLGSLYARADEGMWLPHLLGQQRYANMKAKGLKLTAEQLYSINKPSVKDAIVIFGGGCTGEIVSAEGLVFTNHHCGYGAISGASTVEHNYLRDGFYAKTKADEIPAPGLSVTFLVKIDDVTAQVMDSMKQYTPWDRWAVSRDSVLARIARKATEGSGYTGRVYSMFRDNQFLLYTFETFRDVRLVGTPPESVGKFGGDTDNWEWPRHTGDFSIFRIYMGADGKPSDYKKENVPYKAKYFLPISLKGVKEGDFSMIFGYPGGTNRYETSFGVKMATEVRNPSFVYMRDIRLKAMWAEMRKSEANKLQQANAYAGLANYWKFYDGDTKQLRKYDVYGTKQKQEAALSAWAKQNNKAEYAGLSNDFSHAYDAWMPFEKGRVYYEEGLAGSGPRYASGPLLYRFAGRLERIERMLVRTGESQASLRRDLEALTKDRTTLLTTLNRLSEQAMMAQVLKAYYTDIPADQQPTQLYANIKRSFGDLKDDATYKAYIGSVFANTMILDDAKWNAFVANPDGSVLQNDPAYALNKAFRENWMRVKPQYDMFNTRLAELSHLYLKGSLEMNKGKALYPDANSSMRTSYGKVASYRPRDGVRYDYVTTASGILDKYKPGDPEFDLPASQVEMLRKKDFGPYSDAQRGDLVVCYITTDDITGGNSGSPVLNANGELIGLAFDGNYEALSHKINFDKDMCRTICVDIRYVLWCVDKLGGAQNIIKELKIVK